MSEERGVAAFDVIRYMVQAQPSVAILGDVRGMAESHTAEPGRITGFVKATVGPATKTARARHA